MSELTTKLKELGEKWANLPDCKEANEIADECMDKLPELLSRIEELEKACAEMRKVLGWSYRWLGCDDCPADGQCAECEDMSSAIDHSLSTSCGSEYIHRDEVRPLVALLRQYHDTLPTTESTHILSLCEKLLKGETK